MAARSNIALMPSVLDIRTELFRRRDFDFITVKENQRHTKQDEALRVLTDKLTTDILYGGAAGGAKSWTGCSWLIFMCQTCPRTKWFIGREELKRLRESTLLTLFKVCNAYGLKKGKDYKNNGSDHFIQFTNGSRIDLLDLRFLPSDPLYERYGSTEFTGGWIEEGGEIHFGAYDTLKTRVGRHMNDHYGIIGKILITCNPKKNWLYTLFYKPSVTGSLPDGHRYIACLVDDNPFIESGYIERLDSTSDSVKYKRLRRGEWDYDTNPNALCEQDALRSIFSNDLARHSGIKFLTADIARFGSDKAIIAVWDGYVIIDVITYDVSRTTEIQNAINHLRRKHNIPTYRCIADEDGVGGGVVDNCGILGFKNGGSPFKGENYENLQTQCGYKIADHINASVLGIDVPLSVETKEVIIAELEQLQTWNSDRDGKLQIKPKEQIKQDIGHSPDWRDVILMRAYFDYDKPSGYSDADIMGSFS